MVLALQYFLALSIKDPQNDYISNHNLKKMLTIRGKFEDLPFPVRYTCMHAPTHACTHTYERTRSHAHERTHTHLHTYERAHVHAHACTLSLRTFFTHPRTHSRIHPYMLARPSVATYAPT